MMGRQGDIGANLIGGGLDVHKQFAGIGQDMRTKLMNSTDITRGVGCLLSILLWILTKVDTWLEQHSSPHHAALLLFHGTLRVDICTLGCG
jgi:hypothetical protein